MNRDKDDTLAFHLKLAKSIQCKKNMALTETAFPSL